MFRKLLVVLMMAASMVVVGFGVSGTAQASPGGCSTSSAYADRLYGAYSYCAYGTGQHRVQINCSSYTGGSYYKWGPWVYAAQRSYSFCNHPSERVLGRWTDTR